MFQACISFLVKSENVCNVSDKTIKVFSKAESDQIFQKCSGTKENKIKNFGSCTIRFFKRLLHSKF
jgi:hypothetical protein